MFTNLLFCALHVCNLPFYWREYVCPKLRLQAGSSLCQYNRSCLIVSCGHRYSPEDLNIAYRCVRFQCIAKHSKLSKILMIENHIKINNMILLSFLLAGTTGLLLLSASTSPGYASTGGQNSTIKAPLTSNQIAAGAPIPPNYTTVQQESECVAANPNPPW